MCNFTDTVQESRGYTVAVFNRTVAKIDNFTNTRGKGKKIVGTRSHAELVSSLMTPRKIMLMVKAGDVVDLNIDALVPLLDKGDVIIDGG
jgi:6-phosphogluconate dehydrogenase